MVIIFGRVYRPCMFRFIAFLFVLTWSSSASCGEIHDAVKNNDTTKVKKLLKDNPDLVLSKDEDGFTPLHLAVANGYKEMAELLVANKAEVHAKDDSGSTPLHQAAGLKASTVIWRKCFWRTSGLTPLHYATQANNQDMVKMPVRPSRPSRPLFVTQRLNRVQP